MVCCDEFIRHQNYQHFKTKCDRPSQFFPNCSGNIKFPCLKIVQPQIIKTGFPYRCWCKIQTNIVNRQKVTSVDHSIFIVYWYELRFKKKNPKRTKTSLRLNLMLLFQRLDVVWSLDSTSRFLSADQKVVKAIIYDEVVFLSGIRTP